MRKTLSNILTIFKVAKIVAKVVFILCIVGGAGCLIALSTLPIFRIILPIQSLVKEGLDLPSVYLACTVGAIACAGEAILAFLAERYFGNVLNAGTPFTREGAKESFRLGLASIIVSVATSVVLGIAFAIIFLISPGVSEFDIGTSISLSTGLFFMFLSLVFKHGAELQESAEAPTQEGPTSETETL